MGVKVRTMPTKTKATKTEVERLGCQPMRGLCGVWRAPCTHCRPPPKSSDLSFALPIVSINMSNSSLKNTKDATARFEVELGREAGGGGGDKGETIAMEFGHEGMWEFFKDLDRIQEQLDTLTS